MGGAGGWSSKPLDTLTLLRLLLLVLASAQEGEDDASLGVEADGSDHHPTGALHYVGAWQARERGLGSLERFTCAFYISCARRKKKNVNVALHNYVRYILNQVHIYKM